MNRRENLPPIAQSVLDKAEVFFNSEYIPDTFKEELYCLIMERYLLEKRQQIFLKHMGGTL